jgi:MFS family permease
MPALGHRDFRNFILGSFVSNVGGNVQMWAVMWHVYHLTQSSLMVGLVAGIRVVPLLIFSLIGGVMADSHDRRKILLICQAAMALVAILIAWTTFSGYASVWVLFTLVTLNVIPMAFNNPARQAMLANLVPREHFPNAASVNGIQWRLSDILGPAIAGILIGLPIGPENGLALCYALNAVTFIALIYVVWLLPSSPEPEERERMTTPLMLGMIKDGLRFVFQRPILRDTMTLDFCAFARHCRWSRIGARRIWIACLIDRRRCPDCCRDPRLDSADSKAGANGPLDDLPFWTLYNRLWIEHERMVGHVLLGLHWRSRHGQHGLAPNHSTAQYAR